MKKLKNKFTKNDLVYRLLSRSDKAALFELRLPGGEMIGYEVTRIYINKAGKRFGKYYPESESISCNKQFAYDGSKAFFPKDYVNAIEYMSKFRSGWKISATFSSQR